MYILYLRFYGTQGLIHKVLGWNLAEAGKTVLQRATSANGKTTPAERTATPAVLLLWLLDVDWLLLLLVALWWTVVALWRAVVTLWWAVVLLVALWWALLVALLLIES
ncbi:hypothetical protein BABINDRAFT_152480 [Babjeviella inositovora NRRL Y-12698]|uniref:Uncharacterized protein n=1 Tax=Babjeviella inositovora NRRL Y-12698 TaxID=984486 RepID=A0A1E3QNR6_9ASCO|nr:uncharacterized protein BABINDRAFT_152480 [Babjeviella inositovora NRRL Y-12698]ODQ78732.1 hypothetical protein BABINDRAFT_152480 [Babjeviella inositovora NRRL Y-12698]